MKLVLQVSESQRVFCRNFFLSFLPSFLPFSLLTKLCPSFCSFRTSVSSGCFFSSFCLYFSSFFGPLSSYLPFINFLYLSFNHFVFVSYGRGFRISSMVKFHMNVRTLKFLIKIKNYNPTNCRVNLISFCLGHI